MMMFMEILMVMVMAMFMEILMVMVPMGVVISWTVVVVCIIAPHEGFLLAQQRQFTPSIRTISLVWRIATKRTENRVAFYL